MISVISPSIRPEALRMNAHCLDRQTFQDWEWVIITPASTIELDRQLDHFNYVYVPDPPKREGDFYQLNQAWNAGFKAAKGELLISIVDGMYFEPDALERLWRHYQFNHKLIVSGVGHQYKELQNGKPEIEVWHDPRTMYPESELTNPQHIEWCLTSLPKFAIEDIGGMDEDYDRVAALSEKDANQRMAKAGYQFLIDKGLEYRAIYHPRLSPIWDEKYKEGCVLFEEKVNSLMNGTRSYRIN